MATVNERSPPAWLDLRVGEKWYSVAGQAPRLALRQVALTMAEGELVAIMGPSGCGKTTLLKIVAGLDTAYSGHLSLARRRDGAPCSIGFVFQEPRLLPWRTTAENIALVERPGADPASVDRLLDTMGLAAARDLFPRQLSLGMSRRVAIARALAVIPDLLLMDEPFVSLDPATAEALEALLLRLRRERPVATILVTHDLREALRLADRVILLSAAPGTVLAEVPINLSPAARADPAALEDCRAAIAGRHRALLGDIVGGGGSTGPI
jgi:NitT/TauT family transport system ATP-binding protein